MEKYITDPSTGLDYELVGDYYLIAGEDDPALGLWGQRRLRYLKANRPFLYDDLLLSGQLEQHLHAIDADAADPMAWVQRMNSIRVRVRELVNHELIYN